MFEEGRTSEEVLQSSIDLFNSLLEERKQEKIKKFQNHQQNKIEPQKHWHLPCRDLIHVLEKESAKNFARELPVFVEKYPTIKNLRPEQYLFKFFEETGFSLLAMPPNVRLIHGCGLFCDEWRQEFYRPAPNDTFMINRSF